MIHDVFVWLASFLVGLVVVGLLIFVVRFIGAVITLALGIFLIICTAKLGELILSQILDWLNKRKINEFK